MHTKCFPNHFIYKQCQAGASNSPTRLPNKIPVDYFQNHNRFSIYSLMLDPHAIKFMQKFKEKYYCFCLLLWKILNTGGTCTYLLPSYGGALYQVQLFLFEDIDFILVGLELFHLHLVFTLQ